MAVAAFGLAALFLLLATALLYQALASWRDRRRFPPPGRLVDIGGRRLHLVDQGQGTRPAVVILAGSSNPVVVWAEAQHAIATFARVVAYDRAGYGWSDPAPGPHTGEAVVRDLHALLLRADIPGPYLLVGHSLGALYARLYTQQYPADVAGLILVDPYTEGEWRTMPDWVNRSQTRFRRLAAILARVGVVRLMVRLNPGIADGGRNLLGRFPPRVRSRLLSAFSSTALWRAAFAEWLQVPGLCQAVARELGTLPVHILCAGRNDLTGPQAGKLWSTMKAAQAELLALSPGARLTMIEDCGHGVPLERPEAVVEAVRAMLAVINQRVLS